VVLRVVLLVGVSVSVIEVVSLRVRLMMVGRGRVAGLVEAGIAVVYAAVHADADADAVDVDVAVGRPHIAVHFLLDRLRLFARAGAFRLRHGGLEEVDEVVEVGGTERVEEFLCG